MKRVVVVDYGMGNLHSVAKALEHVAPIDWRVQVSADAEVIRHADHVVFPGVGAIRDCMAEIRRLHLDELIKEIVQRIPVLGICVGMQSLLSHSEENEGVDCIDLIPGHVRFFGKGLKDEHSQRLKVPHMGWNQVEQVGNHAIWQGIPDNSRFYFVHSYYVQADQPADVIGRGYYGVKFDAVLAVDNLVAVQFHPEKSAALGLQLLKNFLSWQP